MTNVVCYLRESTAKQDIGTQRQLLRQHCNKNNIEYREFVDAGVSGTVAFRDRPQSRRLLAEVKAGKIKEIVVYRLDRLGRDHADTFASIGALLAAGVKLVSLKEGAVENSPSGRFVTGIHSLVASYERETTLDRSIDAMRRLAANGVWLGGTVPYGYRVSGRGKTARLVKSTEKIPDLALSEADVVVRIYRWASEGRSCEWIARELNDLEIPTAYVRDGRRVAGRATSGLWTSARVRNLIVQPLHKGVRVWGQRKFVRDANNPQRRVLRTNPRDRWQEVPVPELALVSEETWTSAVEAIRQHRLVAMGHPTADYLLRGMVRCSCGLCYYGSTTARWTTKKQADGKRVRCASGTRCVYYMHSRRSPKARCTSAALRGDHLEQAVWSDIEDFLRRPGAVLEQLEAQMENQGAKGRKVEDEIRELENALASDALKRKRAQDFLIDGTLERRDYDRQLSRIAAAESSVEKQLAELRQRTADEDAAAEALAKARDVLEEWRRKSRGPLTFAKRREIVEALVASISVEPRPGQQSLVRVKYRFEAQNQRQRVSRADRFMPGHKDPCSTDGFDSLAGGFMED